MRDLPTLNAMDENRNKNLSSTFRKTEILLGNILTFIQFQITVFSNRKKTQSQDQEAVIDLRISAVKTRRLYKGIKFAVSFI